MLNLYLLAHQKKTLQFLFLLQQLNESPKTSRCRRWGIGDHPFQSCLPLPILSIRPSQNRSMRLRGNLKSWNDERGFGFIEPAQGGHDIFVHIKAFPPSANRPKIGQALTFEIEAGPNGKQRARSVQYRIPKCAPKTYRAEFTPAWSLPQLLAIPAFASVWLFVASRWSVNPMVIAVYFWLSLLTFIVYALDKWAAINGNWRTPERTLHILGVAGGWPGALIAQQFLRHKCSKPSFMVVFWVTVALNVAGFVAWHSGLIRNVRA